MGKEYEKLTQTYIFNFDISFYTCVGAIPRKPIDETKDPREIIIIFLRRLSMSNGIFPLKVLFIVLITERISPNL